MTSRADAPSFPAAVLWDMDGTLVDTEPYWIAAETEVVEAHGGTWSHDQALDLVGNELIVSATMLRDKSGIDLDPEVIVELLLDGVVARVERSVPWRPGARELLEELRVAGVPCALVTMSYQRFVEPVLASLPEGSFAEVVTGDQVEFGKPHPEPYLQAARLLDVRPEDCVAIEDSNTGARSAEAAGCVVLVIENHVPVAPSDRRVFRETLAVVGLDQIRSLDLD